MDAAGALRTTMVLLGAYALGCLATGYYLVRFHASRDIRQTGSGSSGATNVSRVLGWRGFVITLILDTAKGILAVALARKWQLEPWAIWVAIIAVVAGHVWPVQLRFRGGKGAATYLGSLLALDWRIALMLLPLTLLGYLAARNPTMAGLIAMGLHPLLLWVLGYPATTVFGSATVVVLVLFAHRANIRDWICQIRLDEGLGRE